jgi:Leucine-rich repeat (LRR) protein
MNPEGGHSCKAKHTGTRPELTRAVTSEASQQAQPQPSADDQCSLLPMTGSIAISSKRDIPNDLVQNTAEYLGRVASLLSFRRVSSQWQSAVCDAVGYLNGRCWDRFELNEFEGPLWTSLRVDDPIVVARCAVLCLRSRLETVDWLRCDSFYVPLWLRGENNTKFTSLLGDNNVTLTALNLDSAKFADTVQLRELRGLKRLRLHIPTLEVSMVSIIGTLQTLEALDLTSHSVTDLKGLEGLVALRELTLSSTLVTNESFAGLEQLLARLHKLDLSECKYLKTISNLAPATSLRELNLSDCGVENLQGLEKLVALETLDVSCIPARDLSILRQCPRLTTLTAETSDYYSQGEIQAMVDSAAHCLVTWRLQVLPGERTTRKRLKAWEDLAKQGFLRFAVLRELDVRDIGVESESIPRLAEIPMLEVLNLSGNPLDDVSALVGCRALRELSLSSTRVTGEGIAGLEEIVTLQKLDLSGCFDLTSVINLRHCAALRQLGLGGTPITNAGIEGLERIATLTTLNLSGSESLTSVSTLRESPSLRELDISYTEVAGAGIVGLEEVGTLEHLYALCCEQLDDVTSLRRCRALRFLNLRGSSVTDASMAAFACVATLETLNLADCAQVRDVSALSESVSLRELDLTSTKVDNVGIAGLERIPTLTSLQLETCVAVTDVRHLILSKSLRRLTLSSESLTDAGIAGIEMAPALEVLDLRSCPGIADAAAVARRAAEYAVQVHFTREPDDDAKTESSEEA